MQPSALKGHPIKDGQPKWKMQCRRPEASIQISQLVAKSVLRCQEDLKMSQQPVQEQNAMVYSDEASMGNGSNRESTLQVVTPQVIDEPKVGLFPKCIPNRVLRFSVTEGFL